MRSFFFKHGDGMAGARQLLCRGQSGGVSVADGVVVGSALVHRLLEGAGPDGAAAFVAEMRAAIDA